MHQEYIEIGISRFNLVVLILKMSLLRSYRYDSFSSRGTLVLSFLDIFSVIGCF